MRHGGILRVIFSLCFWTTRTSLWIWALVWRSTDDGNVAVFYNSTNSSQQLARFLHVMNAARSVSSADGESPGVSKIIRVWQVAVLRLEMSVWGVSVRLQTEGMGFMSFPRKNTAMKMETSIRNSVWTVLDPRLPVNSSHSDSVGELFMRTKRIFPCWPPPGAGQRSWICVRLKPCDNWCK